MNFLELVKKRYSVRKFSDKEIEDEKLQAVLEAGRRAPTAYNYQPQKIFVLKSKEALEKARSITRYTFNAPMVLLVCADMDISWKSKFDPGYDSAEMDIAIVTTHMMLQATEVGLGTLWVRGFNPKDVKMTFSLLENIELVCILLIGYPAEGLKPGKVEHSRRPLVETVTEL